MKLTHILAVAALTSLFCSAQTALADDISVSIGTQNFTSGTTISSGTFTSTDGGQPAPFNAVCGSDVTNPPGNCSATWTFTGYTVPSGDTITAATLTLGIWDIDSAAAGNQIGSFTLDGTDNLTALLNAASEGLNGGAGAPNSQYDVLTISITDAAGLADLESGPATFALTLQGPGLGALLTTPYNGAGLDFSTLDMTGTPGNNNGGGGTTTTPEPSSLLLLGTGLLGLVRLKRPWRK